MDGLAIHAIGFRVSVAIHAPSHAEAVFLSHTFHRFDGAVAPLAFDGRRNVRSVIEVSMVWQVVDANPPDRIRLLCRIFFQILGEANGVVQFAQLVRNDHLRWALLCFGSPILGLKHALQRGHELVTSHTNVLCWDSRMSADFGV
jgi:hypothetical protein